MKTDPVQKLYENHGMPRLFARPRTPNDNPFIESAFITAKRTPEDPSLGKTSKTPKVIAALVA